MSKLLRSAKTAQTGISMQATGTHVDLYLFGIIGDWWDGNTATSVLDQLRYAKNVETITVYLSTVGGYFNDGLPIYNLLKQHAATVTVEVMGYALSMGSVIMLAGDKIRIAQNAMVMIHNAQGGGWGSPAEIRKAADVLEIHEKAIIPRYMERMGKSAEQVQALLDEETWFTADEALAIGLVDEISDPVDLSNIDKKQPANAWQFAAENFKHPPPAFVERVDNAADQYRPWFEKTLNRMVGIPPAPIPPPDEASPMTPENLQAISAMLDEKLAAALKPPVVTPPEPPADAAPAVELAAETARADKAEAELAKLKAEIIPPTTPPINTGPAGHSVQRFS